MKLSFFSLTSRIALLVAISPFVIMVCHASSDWITAYADHNRSPKAEPATPKMERITQLDSEEQGGLRRSMMKEEAINDLYAGLDTLEQTIERFRLINSSVPETLLHQQQMHLPLLDSRLPFDANQALVYAKTHSLSNPKLYAARFQELLCEAVFQFSAK